MKDLSLMVGFIIGFIIINNALVSCNKAPSILTDEESAEMRVEDEWRQAYPEELLP